MNSNKKPAYQTPIEEILSTAQVTLKGLTKQQVEKQLEEYGYNQLSERNPVNPFFIFINQFSNPLVFLLILSAIISMGLHEFIDAGFIATIVLINAVIGFVQEYKAENTIKALKKLAATAPSIKR